MKYPYTRTYLDRHGKLRVEYRRHGRTIRLRAPVGTPEFQAAYDAAKAHVEREQQTARSAVSFQPDTFGWLCTEYLNSVEYGQFGRRAQRARRTVFEGMLQEPIRPNSRHVFAACPLRCFVAEHVKVLRDRKTSLPKAANMRLAALDNLFKWAIENRKSGMVENPTHGIPKLELPTDRSHENQSARNPPKHVARWQLRVRPPLDS
jgi:hypothetical protein